MREYYNDKVYKKRKAGGVVKCPKRLYISTDTKDGMRRLRRGGKHRIVYPSPTRH